MKRLVLTTFLFIVAILGVGHDRMTGAQTATVPAGQAPELVLQTGHSKLVEAVVICPGNKWLASGSFDNTIKIWDVDSGLELRSLAGHTGAVKALAASPDGQWVFSGGNDRTLRVWEVKSGGEIRTLAIDDQTIEAIALSSDGKWIASGGSMGEITIRNAATGSETAKLSAHTAAVSVLTFNPDGSRLASGSSDGAVAVWDIAKQKPATLKGHAKRVTALRFSPAGDLLASGAEDNSGALRKVSNGRKMADLHGHRAEILAFHFFSNEKLISADSVGSLKAWNAVSGKWSSDAHAIVNDASIECKALGFSTNGDYLATGNGDGTLTLLDTNTGKKIKTLENHTSGSYDVAFSPDHLWLASASFDNSVKIWDLQTGDSLRPLRGHTGRVRKVAYHPDGSQLYSGSADHTIRVWDAMTQKPIEVLRGHSNSISALAVGAKGKYLVSGGLDQTVGIWELGSDVPPRFLEGHKGEVISVAISTDESVIASAGMDGTIRLWDASSGVLKQSIESGSGEIGAVSISPDGKLLASGGNDKAVTIREIASGRLLRTIPGHSGRINAVAFSNDGLFVTSSGQDKTIRIHSVSDGRPVHEMKGHSGTVFSTAYSAKGDTLASASDDGSIALWKVETGARLATLISLKNSSDWLVVSPQGFFDGSPASWDQLSWRFDNDTFNIKPVEVFFNEFFLPGLLGDLINRRPLPLNSDISKRDRRQPEVTLAAIGQPPGSEDPIREIKVKVNITEAPAGAKDVRLFRNGALVRVWRGDVLEGRTAVSLEAAIPIVAGENRLTAYAFNTDDVKSRNVELNITGPPTLARKGVSYILAIGVNEYSNPNYNLNVAVADAMDFADELELQQARLGQYERVEKIMLADKDATKANILKLLAELTTKIQVEDWVTIFFAGHGIKDEDRFYLVPHDLGYMGSQSRLQVEDLQVIFNHSISDEEINRLVEGIDARQLLLVIDACNSGQVLETEEKRRGPMNSKGLAHLAYEKGMYILTASQSYQDAKEDDRLGHGYLTYALVQDGLKTRQADRSPKDGQILLREWIDFAADRVPEIDQEEVNKGHKRARQLQREKARAAGRTDDLNIQRPRVFYRRESDAQPIIVSRY